MDTTEIQSILRDHYKQLYASKMDKVKEMDKFLERYSSFGKKLNNAVFRTTVEPRNHHIRLSKSKGYDKYPMILLMLSENS